jgi:hypothetical protein
MPSRLLAAGVVFALGFCAVGVAGEEPPLGEKVLAYCRQHKGEQVGEGECSNLAEEALRSAGAKGRGADDPGEGDYVWGKLVFRLEREGSGLKSTGSRADIKPGDVIQFRDAKFQGRRGSASYTLTAPHHTSVVVRVEDKGRTLRVLHQNWAGKKVVREDMLRLDELREGWLRVYEPEP